MNLSERVALIVGGESPVAEWIARAYAKAGADLVLDCKIPSLSWQIAHLGRRALSAQHPLLAVDRAITEYGRIDVLVNSLCSRDSLDGALRVTMESARQMMQQVRGRIINIVPNGDSEALAFTEALATKLAAYKIYVTSISTSLPEETLADMAVYFASDDAPEGFSMVK